MFKKKKINNYNKKKKNNDIINIFWLIVIFGVFVLWIFTLSFAKQFNFLNNSSDVVLDSKTDIVEEKKDDNKINILLLGRGGMLNDAPNLTDSIILASVNKDNKTISMFSIPRDLYVKYKSWKSWKINKTYALARAKTWSIEAWIDALKYNIELLTWEDVDYYVNIDFKGFINFVDAIWGVKIEVPKTLVDEKFPDNNWGYRTFIVKKWTWLFDWETALNYARSRHSTSDFDRSLRQQQIIEAIKNKLLEWWFLSKVSKAKKFYDVFSKYVYTDIWLKDAVSIFNEINDKWYQIVSSNLNDSCFEGDPYCIKWWFLYTPDRELYWWAAVLLVNGSGLWNINDYDEVEGYMNLVFDKTIIYKENISISVLNSTNVSLLAWNFAFELRRYWFNVPNNKYSISTLRKNNFNNSFINYSKEVSDSETIKYLKEKLPNFIFSEVTDLEYSLDSEAKIEIIIWANYEEIFKDLEKNL